MDLVDGEVEVDEQGEDNALYCFCQEKSYGEMIGCDNEDCRFEWVSSGRECLCSFFGGCFSPWLSIWGLG